MRILFISSSPPSSNPDHGGAVRRIQAIHALSELLRERGDNSILEILSLCDKQQDCNESSLPDNTSLSLFQDDGLPGKIFNRGTLRKGAHYLGSLLSDIPAAATFRANRRLASELNIRSRNADLAIIDHLWMGAYLPFIRCRRALLSYGDEAGLLRRRIESSNEKSRNLVQHEDINPFSSMKKLPLYHELHRTEIFTRNCLEESDYWLCVDGTEQESMNDTKCMLIPMWSDNLSTVNANEARSLSSQNRTVLFIGRDNWPPNREAVRLLEERIWPDVKRAHPDARLIIVGTGPGSTVSTQTDNISSEMISPTKVNQTRNPGIAYYHWIDDLSSLLENAAVFVSPLPWGHGMKVKMLAAAAAALPLIGTSESFRGLTVGENIPGLCSDHPEEIANNIVKTMNDPELYARLSDEALNLSKRFSMENGMISWRKLLNLIESSR